MDGVNNTADLCPGTASGAPVDANGCAVEQLTFQVTLNNLTGCEVSGTIDDGQMFVIPIDGQIILTVPGGETTLSASTAMDSPCAGAAGGATFTLTGDTEIDITVVTTPVEPLANRFTVILGQ
jgi:hypothetical protein